MKEQTVQAMEHGAHVAGQTAQLVEKTSQVVSEVSKELDWATVREAAVLAGVAVLKFVGWWLCGRGFHEWQAWEYEDGTVVKECASCRVQAPV